MFFLIVQILWKKIVMFLLNFMQKDDLLPYRDGKLVAVFQDKRLQLGNVLTGQIIDDHEMQAVVVGITTDTIEERILVLIQRPVDASPQMEDSVDGVARIVVVMAKTNQIVGMLFQELFNDGDEHAAGVLVGSPAALTLGKPELIVEHAMTPNLGYFEKMEHIKAIRGIVELHRRIASPS